MGANTFKPLCPGSYGSPLVPRHVPRLSLRKNLGEQPLQSVQPRILPAEIVGWSGVVDVDETCFESCMDDLSRLLFGVNGGFRQDIQLALPISVHLFPSTSDGISGRPMNVFESTLPVFRFRVVIVLTFRWTETSTLSSFEKYVSRQPIVRPLLFLLMSIRILLEVDLGTAGGATGGETVAPRSHEGLALAHEGELIRLLTEGSDEMEVVREAARQGDSGLCREQQWW
jgi:hypothetical protein